jgi:hypothetical protein
MLYGSPDIGHPDYRGVTYAGGLGFGHSDTVGCGWDIKNETIFFTKNGEKLAPAFSGVRGRLFPAIGVGQESAITANFGLDIVASPFMWKPANDKKLE